LVIVGGLFLIAAIKLMRLSWDDDSSHFQIVFDIAELLHFSEFVHKAIELCFHLG